MVTSIVPDHVFIDRIIEILKANKLLQSLISEWRFGDLGDEATTRGEYSMSASREQNASSYPLCYCLLYTSPSPRD